MPVHDWKRVEAGIFHHFHHSWIEEIQRVLNAGLLPDDYYAMAEQQAAGFGPDVLTLQSQRHEQDERGIDKGAGAGTSTLQLAPPTVPLTAETANEFFRRKQSSIAVRHVSGDDVVAVVEILSPGNKSSKIAFRALIDKACELLEYKINLLVLDLFPPTNRDPNGFHAALWDEIADQSFVGPASKPLTLAAYQSAFTVKAFIQSIAVGGSMPDMPLYLEPDGHVSVPLELTYQAAFAAFPRRWQAVLNA